MRTPLTFTLSILASSLFVIGTATAQEFTDISADSPLAPAVLYLKEKGMVQSAPLFKPNDKLNRAQAAKILAVPLKSADALATITTTSFTDVPAGSWYLPFAEAARTLGIVDSVEKFNPTGALTKAAFTKMLLSSKKIDYKTSFSDLTGPLSSDVSDASQWYFPVLRYALASSMTSISKDGNLSPGRELTRGDMALLAYRLDMYLAGRRTQALLSQGETEIGNVLAMIEAKSADQAELAGNRAVVTVRGALSAKPNEPIVKAATKVAEGYKHLALGFKAGNSGNLDACIDHAKQVYELADKAKEFNPDLAFITDKMQQSAKEMADAARKAKGQ